MQKTDHDDPCQCAVRALRHLHEAERIFPFGSVLYRQAIADARKAIGDWSVGMVNDMDRDTGLTTPRG